MSSIDDLFKKPLSTSKRKFEIKEDANAAYKATKLDASSDVKSNGHATVSDENEVDEDIAGPELPPDLEDPVNDEDGRFFGGGVERNTADALDYIDERDQDDAGLDQIDIPWLRKTALNFEKRISKNTELRAKYEDSPQKFMGSEADLDADIKGLSILSEHPELYEEFAKLGCVASLISLLSHENTDIAIDAIELVNELTDEDVNAGQEQWDVLVDAMLESDLLNLLYENITRLDESLETDRSGVYHVLNVLENLSSRPAILSDVGKQTKFIQWLISRAQAKEPQTSQNKQYAAEILAILLQSSVENRSTFISIDGIDVCLQSLSPYRKKDPAKGTEEEEFMENLFDCLTCSVDDVEGKIKFVEAEGVELGLIMLREGGASKPRALRLLDHALGGSDGGLCCEKLVEAAGLKVIFNLYRKRQDRETNEHVLGMLASLLRSLPAKSSARIRLLAKFEERNWRYVASVPLLRFTSFFSSFRLLIVSANAQ